MAHCRRLEDDALASSPGSLERPESVGRPPPPGVHLPRPRLVTRLAGARVSAVTAAGGYGKSVLGSELAEYLGDAAAFVEIAPEASEASAVASAIRRALRSAGLAGLADALDRAVSSADQDRGKAFAQQLAELLQERTGSVLLVIEDVHRANGPAASALEAIARAMPLGQHLLVTGRRLHPGLAAALTGAVQLGEEDLSFTAAEVAALGELLERPVDAAAAASIARATAGWPAAVTLALRAQVTSPQALRAGIGSLVDRLLEPADDAARASAELLAHLPLLSPRAAEMAAGAGSLDRLIDIGIPIRARSDGWLVLPDPVREVLAGRTTLPTDAAVGVASVYLDGGGAQVALPFLLGRGEHDALATLLADRPWQALQALEPAELRSLLSVLPDQIVDANPRLLLSIAHIYGSAGQFAWRSSVLERAAKSAATAPDDPLLREIRAEQGCDASANGDVERAAELADGVLRDAASGEVLARARALVALGRGRAFTREAGAMAEAADLLTQAVALLRLTREPELLGGTLQVLGYAVHFAEGDLDAARLRLREAADAAPLSPRARAGVQTFLADALVYAGDLDEAEAVLREVAAVAHRLRDQLLLGYHAWMQAGIHSRRGDAAAVLTWLAEAQRHPGDWFAHPTGIEFLADAVDHLGRIGEHDEAARFLARVRQRVATDTHEDVDQIELVARAIHGARAGDPVAAEVDLLAVLETEQLPRREAWRIHLLRGLAAHRRGDEPSAARHAARAFEQAAALGHPELPALHEPHAAELLVGLARQRGSRAAVAAGSAPPRLAVRLLGGFAVTAGGRPIEPPPGRPATLVKLLGVVGAAIPVDEVLEVLWPDVDPETGRSRMRNVLSRLRSACGELVRRDGETLVLAPDVVVDAADFETAARAALSTQHRGEPAMARRALALYGGELLPADRYEDFTVGPRERLAMRQLGLLDRLAAQAASDGDVDEALRLYDDAIAAAPLEEHRYEEAATLALSSGRRQRARHFVERSASVLEELGVAPSAGLHGLAATLGVDLAKQPEMPSQRSR
jgi:DNA-binding SARP family transcriptional activator/tetratricopeptide (TPR) repeat protein